MSVKLLEDEIIAQIDKLFTSELKFPVEILLFSTNDQCYTCEEIQLLLNEITSISDKVHYRVHNLGDNPEEALLYHVEQAPTLVIAGRDGESISDFGVRLMGIPSGYEFGSFIQSIIQVSKRDSGLKSETRKLLEGLSEPIHLKVFVTPT